MRIGRSLCLCSALIVVLASNTPFSQTQYSPNELFVTFAPSYMPSQENISTSPAQFGIGTLDELLATYECQELTKLVPTFDEFLSPAGQRIERTFLLEFDESVDILDIASELESLPYFERVELNWIVYKEYFGTKRDIPPTSTAFEQQWYLHHPVKDKLDIDAPEAWAIERGVSERVIVIHDSGTMVDTSTTQVAWGLHSDFVFYWTPENVGASLILNGGDLNSNDSPLDDDTLVDNVIGWNWSPHYLAETNPYIVRFWHSIPTDWLLPTGLDGRINGSNCVAMFLHGTHVASVAAAGFANGTGAPSGGDATGVAPGCRIHIVRTEGGETKISDQIPAVLYAAQVGDVVNMSWGFKDNPGPLFEDAINAAVNDLDAVLVAAVGNDTLSTDVWWPARYDSVVSVGATDSSGSTMVHSIYSNYSSTQNRIDLVAPVDDGIFVDTHTACSSGSCPCVQSDSTRFTAFGTSFAAPQVAGVAALIRSRFPALRAPDVLKRLARCAEFYPEWQTEQFGTKKYGNGKVNAYRAVTEWGQITTSTTWSATDTRDGKYYVSGDLSIESGATLTINPGVVVKVAPDHEQGTPDAARVRITVKSGGTLNVVGTSTNKVTFEGFTDSSPSASDWTGIHFESGSAGNLTHVNIRNAQCGVRSFISLTLNNCTIEDGVDGIQSSNNLVVRNSIIQDCSSNGISWLGGNLEIRNVEIGNCGYGVNQSASVTGTILSRDLNIHDVTYRGINLSASNGGATIKKTKVEDATDGIVLISQSSATVDSCSANSNDIGLYIISSSGTSVRRSSFVSNTTAGLYVVYSNSIVELDTISSSAAGVYCYTSSNPSITNSRIISSTVGLKCESSSHPLVRTTRISSGGTGVLALDGSSPDLGIASGEICGSGGQEGQNSIHNNSSYNVANLDAGTTVSAQCDWWGVGTPLASKFYGNVVYTPYRSSDPNPASIWDPGDTPPPPVIPLEYGLHPNRPNPFNPVTTIAYDVPAPGAEVEMVVYDVGGRVVRTLLSGYREPGTHSTTWEGRDDAGSPVASGVYFIRMTAGPFNQTRKVVLLK